jgi:hypothetical protein
MKIEDDDFEEFLLMTNDDLLTDYLEEEKEEPELKKCPTILVWFLFPFFAVIAFWVCFPKLSFFDKLIAIVFQIIIIGVIYYGF